MIKYFTQASLEALKHTGFEWASGSNALHGNGARCANMGNALHSMRVSRLGEQHNKDTAVYGVRVGTALRHFKT